MVTEIAEFYRCAGDEGLRYYPATQSRKGVAIDYNGGTLPPTVRGFAVYDTTVTMDYAVALYGSTEEAEQHEARPVPSVPDTIFDEEELFDPADEDLDNTEFDEEDEFEVSEDEDK